jgi:hypothetical protein
VSPSEVRSWSPWLLRSARLALRFATPLVGLLDHQPPTLVCQVDAVLIAKLDPTATTRVHHCCRCDARGTGQCMPLPWSTIRCHVDQARMYRATASVSCRSRFRGPYKET